MYDNVKICMITHLYNYIFSATCLVFWYNPIFGKWIWSDKEAKGTLYDKCGMNTFVQSALMLICFGLYNIKVSVLLCVFCHTK